MCMCMYLWQAPPFMHVAKINKAYTWQCITAMQCQPTACSAYQASTLVLITPSPTSLVSSE